MEASDPYGARAWNQRIGKELGSAVLFHKGQRRSRQYSRNPITHEPYANVHAANSVSDSMSTAPSLGSCSSKDGAFIERITKLEQVLNEERASKKRVEQELDELRSLCKDKYCVDMVTIDTS